VAQQSTKREPNPVGELLTAGWDCSFFFVMLAVLSSLGEQATLRAIAVLVLIVPAAGQLAMFLLTSNKHPALLRMGAGAALAAISLYLWNSPGWMWVVFAIGASTIWIISFKIATSELIARTRRHKVSGRKQPPELTGLPLRGTWTDVLVACLWLPVIAGVTVIQLWPSAQQFMKVYGGYTISIAVPLAWSVTYVAVWFWLLLDCWRRTDMIRETKTLWLLFIFAGWLVGPTCYYIFVKRPEMND